MNEILQVLDFFRQDGNSKTQEQFAEYLFLKDLILEAAKKERKLNIARSDFDAFGFDLFISEEDKTFNIQLKAKSGKARVWDVHKSLLKINNGRIVLISLKVGENQIIPTYQMFDNQLKNVALMTPPKVNKLLKCQVKLNQFIDISNNLLQIFDSNNESKKSIKKVIKPK